jgi:hypothetical protein
VGRGGTVCGATLSGNSDGGRRPDPEHTTAVEARLDARDGGRGRLDPEEDG